MNKSKILQTIMSMCRITITSILLLLSCVLSSQVRLSSGTRVNIDEDTQFIVKSEFISQGAIIENDGIIRLSDDLTNNDGSLLVSASTGTIQFDGNSLQQITGNTIVDFYGKIVIRNSADVELAYLSGSIIQTIYDTLCLDTGRLILNGFNLNIGSIDPIGGSVISYIQTNSSGVVKRNIPGDGSTSVPFPIGNSTFNPLTILSDTSAVDDIYGLRVVDSKPVALPIDEVAVNRSWVLTETVPGGTSFSATAQWNESDEGVGFDRTGCNVGLTVDNGANVQWGQYGAALGSNPYTQSGQTFDEDGIILVGDYLHIATLNLDFILGGAFDGSIMDNSLNQFIPVEDPYGLGEIVGSVPSNAIDWVRIDFRNSVDISSIEYSFALFVDQNGKLLDTDGNIGVEFLGISESYYISVSHRNHLAVTTASVVNFDVEEPSYDFTISQNQVWQNTNVTANSALKNDGGVFVMWPGDANGDGQVDYSDIDRTIILNSVGTSTPGNVELGTYSDLDVNLDGNIIYNGTNSDRSLILYQAGISTPGNAVLQHLP